MSTTTTTGVGAVPSNPMSFGFGFDLAPSMWATTPTTTTYPSVNEGETQQHATPSATAADQRGQPPRGEEEADPWSNLTKAFAPSISASPAPDKSGALPPPHTDTTASQGYHQAPPSLTATTEDALTTHTAWPQPHHHHHQQHAAAVGSEGMNTHYIPVPLMAHQQQQGTPMPVMSGGGVGMWNGTSFVPTNAWHPSGGLAYGNSTGYPSYGYTPPSSQHYQHHHQQHILPPQGGASATSSIPSAGIHLPHNAVVGNVSGSMYYTNQNSNNSSNKRGAPIVTASKQHITVPLPHHHHHQHQQQQPRSATTGGDFSLDPPTKISLTVGNNVISSFPAPLRNAPPPRPSQNDSSNNKGFSPSRGSLGDASSESSSSNGQQHQQLQLPNAPTQQKPSSTNTTNAAVTPSVEPLLSFIAELSGGLVARPFDRPSAAVTPIPDGELRSLIDLTYASFTTDSDLMNFVKAQFPEELCLQLRDYMLFDDTPPSPVGEGSSTAEAEPQAQAPPPTQRREDSVFVRDFVQHRGTLVVSLIEILGTLPSPCSSCLAPEDQQMAELTSFCPLMKLILRHFDTFCRTQRGCIGLLRVISSTANAPRPVDRIVRTVTSRLDYLIFDSHANYIVSHVLCALDEWPDPEVPPRFEPTNKEEMLQRTSSILALASWGREGSTTTATTTTTAATTPAAAGSASSASSSCPFASRGPPLLTPAPVVVNSAAGCSKVYHGAVPPRRAMAAPPTWRAFIVRLCQVLGDNISSVGTHREASHILEHAIRRVPFGKIPEALPLLHRMVEDVEHVLVPLCHSPCGRHCVQALTETLANKSSGMKFATVRFCVAQLDTLRTVHRPLVVTSPFFDRIDAALRRLPTLTMPADPDRAPRAAGRGGGSSSHTAGALTDAFDY